MKLNPLQKKLLKYLAKDKYNEVLYFIENYIKIDNTSLAPDEVAKMIQAHFAIDGRKE